MGNVETDQAEWRYGWEFGKPTIRIAGGIAQNGKIARSTGALGIRMRHKRYSDIDANGEAVGQA